MSNALVSWSNPFFPSVFSDSPFRMMNRLSAFDEFPVTVTPPMNIRELEKSYEVTAEVPGLSEKDISLEISEGVLTLAGEKHEKKEDSGKGYSHKEISYGAFKRCINLPDGVDASAVEASFNNGVLIIQIPKVEPQKPEVRKVAVKKV